MMVEEINSDDNSKDDNELLENNKKDEI